MMMVAQKNIIISMISKHISDKEGVYSRTALRLGINNKPNKQQLRSMELLADCLLYTSPSPRDRG